MLKECKEAKEPIIIYNDDQKCKVWATEKRKRNRNIYIRYDVCRKAFDNSEVKLRYYTATKRMADTPTKSSRPQKFKTVKILFSVKVLFYETI